MHRRLWVIFLLEMVLIISVVLSGCADTEVSVVAGFNGTGGEAAAVKLPDSDEPETESEPKGFTVVAVGDINLGRGVKARVVHQPQGYRFPFLQVAELLKQGDVVFGNLEEPVTASRKSLQGLETGGKIILKNDPEAMEGLRFAGFNLLSLANNHIMDYYDTGLFDTMRFLDENIIAYAGAGRNIEDARKLTVIEKKGFKIGLLAYTDMAEITYKGNPPLQFSAKKDKAGVAPSNKTDMLEDVANARKKVDFLIVSLHWGVEDSFTATGKQVEFAHALADNGADMLLGHHPHQYQGVEIYKGKPLLYSMGNFIFDQNDPENQEGFIMQMEFTEHGLKRMEGIPYKIVNKNQIVPQTGKDAAALLQRETDLCRKMNTDVSMEKDKLVFSLP